MKNSLSENMLRFGTKNLSETAKQQLLRLTEAPAAAGGYNPFARTGYSVPGALKFKDETSYGEALRVSGDFVNFIKNDTWVKLAKERSINMFTTAGDADEKWWGSYSFGTSAQDIWDPINQVNIMLTNAYPYIALLCFGLGITDLTKVDSLANLLNTELAKKPNLTKALNTMYTDDLYKNFNGFKNSVISMQSRNANPIGSQRCWDTINRAMVMMWNPGFRNVFTPGYNQAVSSYTIQPSGTDKPRD